MRFASQLRVGAVATAVVALACAPGARAEREDRLVFAVSGTALELSDSYANTVASGESVVDRLSEQVIWGASCEELIPSVRVKPGVTLGCTPTDTSVVGSIKDENPLNPGFDCKASVVFKPGSSYVMTAALESAPLLVRPAVRAPMTSLNLTLVPSGNPLNGVCTQPGFESPGRPDYYGIFNKFAAWPPRGPFDEEWTAAPESRSGPVRIEFHSRLVITDTTHVSPLEALLEDVSNTATSLFSGLLNGITPPTSPSVVMPQSGTLTGTWTTAAGAEGAARQAHAASALTVFTLHRHVRANTPSPLRLNLTARGRALLANATSAPTLAGVLTFRPDHGRTARRQVKAATELIPSISSVAFTGSPADPTIVVRGRGLAPLPPPNPASPSGHNGCPQESGSTGADYGGLLNLNDLSKRWSAGIFLPAVGAASCIGLLTTRATGGEVDLELGSFYTQHYPQFTLSAGDEVQIVVGGAVLDVPVAYS